MGTHFRSFAISCLACACVLGAPLLAGAAAPSFYTFESAPVRPLALSADGQTLFAVNTPDDRLEIFRLARDGFVHAASVPVGMEPVAVAVRSEDEVWVVNHLSDSISIVRLGEAPAVVRTLLVGDEPSDIVFAGPDRGRAFVTTAHRGQNSPFPRSEYARPGVGRADVWVFDAEHPGEGLGGDPLTVLTLFGDKPRALATSPDGATVYAAVYHSGNQTTVLHENLVCPGGASVAPCVVGDATYPGGLPAPNVSHEGVAGPNVGLIVRYDPASGGWLDELGRDWRAGVRFDLPDLDVFAIDAGAAEPTEVASYASVGTILFNMAVNPVSGVVYVSNTEAINEVRFEGPGVIASGQKPAGEPASVRGHLHEARISVIRDGTVYPRHLNKHIDYDVTPPAPGTAERSLATPLDMAVSSDGRTLYVSAFGSSKIGIFDTEALESDSFVPDAAQHIELPGGGPAGLVLDEVRGRLYVLTRFDNALLAVDLERRAIVGRASMHNPEPPAVIAGRPFFYDARHTSSNGEASCASCHVFGDMDGLAWDLGNPDGDIAPNPNPIAVKGFAPPFHPMKGPMTTQTFRGLDDTGPLHWRGDRTGGNDDPPGDPLDSFAGFMAFNGAFEGLLGRDEGPLDIAEMEAFARFAMQITPPPNPIRRLDNALREDEARGRELFFAFPGPDFVLCDTCHRIDPELGRFGTEGRSNGVDQTQEFKVPQLRNLYQKIGRFGSAPSPFFFAGDNEHMGPQVRGFGFLHDGSTDTVFRFLSAVQFGRFESLGGDPTRRDTEAFLMAFESNLAPIVGQQITLGAANAEEAGRRLDLMLVRAATPFVMKDAPEATECDVVAHATLTSNERVGFVRRADGLFHPSDGGDPRSDAQLRALAAERAAITYTCAPPGSGERKGVDRDEDGRLDGLDSCPDVANADQLDGDRDGVGDACDLCPGIFDPAQGDADGDGIGDLCELACEDGLDNDGDGMLDWPEDPSCEGPSDHDEAPRSDVVIDVSPGREPNRVWLTRHFGMLVLAILDTPAAPAEEIEPGSLALGPGGAGPIGLGHRGRIPVYLRRDVDRDGDRDLLLFFDARAAGLRAGDESVCLSGEIAGSAFESCDQVVVIDRSARSRHNRRAARARWHRR
jgi:DNA-binding beta-propeller fold protein YncE